MAIHRTEASMMQKEGSRDLNGPLRNLGISLIASLAFITLYSFSSQYGGDGTNDDFAIGIALSGRLPGMDMSLFVNAALCNFVASLNQAIPNINWFWMFERLAALASFATVMFVCLEKSKEIPTLPIFVACTCTLLLVGCTYSGNFSFVACFASVAGGTALLVGVKSPYLHTYRGIIDAISIILISIGFSMRIECFLLYLPFFLLTVAFIVFDESKKQSLSAKSFLPIILSVLCCVLLFTYNQIVWSTNSDLAQWKQYNSARSAISDYPMPSYESISKELEDYGVSENDYHMLCSWMTADDRTFDTETLENVATLADSKGLNQLVLGLPHAAKEYLARLLSEGALLGLIALYIFLVAKSPRKCFGAIVLLTAFALSAYFVATGRFPQRVEYPLWIYTFSVLSLSLKPHFNPSRTSARSFSMGAAAFCLALAFATQVGYFDRHEIKPAFTQTSFEPQGALFDYEKEHPQDIYLFDVGTYTLIEQSFKEKNLPSHDFLAHNATLGGWSTESPYYKSRNEIMGSDSLLRSLAEEDSFHLLTQDPAICDTLVIFFKEHYAMDVKVEIDDGPVDGVYLCNFKEAPSLPNQEALLN